MLLYLQLRNLNMLKDIEGRNWPQYRPDFNGMWSCFETVGDMDALLVSLEVGWAKRHLAFLVSQLMF